MSFEFVDIIQMGTKIRPWQNMNAGSEVWQFHQLKLIICISQQMSIEFSLADLQMITMSVNIFPGTARFISNHNVFVLELHFL